MLDTVTVICALALTAGCAALGRRFLIACRRSEHDRALWLKGAAGLCFSVSDCILCVYCYGSRRTDGMNAAIHATYYAAQMLIAWSIALV